MVAPITIGSGITIGGGIGVGITQPSFTLSSSDFVNFGYNGSYSPGATVSQYPVVTTTGPGQSLYVPTLGLSGGGNPVKRDELVAFWTAQGWGLTDYTARIFTASWGAGSSQSSGIVLVTFTYFDNDNSQLFLGTVNTANNDWQTPGLNMYNGVDLLNELGTFNLPATFTLYSPETADPGNWC